MTADLRTPKEKEREATHKLICKMYRELCNLFPDAKPSRIFDAVGNEVGYSSIGVRRVIVANGLYKAKK